MFILSQRNYDRAVDDYNAAIRLDPTCEIGFNNRGLASQRKRQIDRAIEDYDEAIRLNPASAVAFDNRAAARQITGQADLAIEHSDKAIGSIAASPRCSLREPTPTGNPAQWEFAPIWPTGPMRSARPG